MGVLSAHLGFLAAAAVIGAMGWTLYDATLKFSAASRSVAHTQEVMHGVADVEAAMARAESAQRAYLLTGGSPMTRERDLQLSKLDAAIERVARLTTDNPAQQVRTRRLATLTSERKSIMLVNARLREQSPFDPVRADTVTLDGQQATARVDAVADEIRQEEIRLLGVRQADEQRRLDRTLLILYAAMLVSVAVLLPAYLAFVRQSRRRERAEHQLRDLTESLPVAVYQFRTRKRSGPRFEFVSSSVQSLHGVSMATALDDPDGIMNSVLEADRPALVRSLQQAAQTLSPLDCEYRIGTSEREVRWVRSCASLRRERDGSVLWSGYWADVTETKQLATAVQQAKDDADAANRAKSTFLATMSHEIRTPMNGVLGMLELLALTRLDTEQRGTLGVVRESGRSLLRIIDDILDFSKIEAGRLELKPEAASVLEVVERTRQLYTGIASSKGLLLTCSVDPGISAALLFDPLRVSQILNNFVSNALKFTLRGSVEIRAELLERVNGHDRLRFAVTDTGIGISLQDQLQLFRPFAQADHSSAWRGGTGLGLVICRRLAETMDGSVEMHSELGRGTTMTLSLSLPVADVRGLATVSAEQEHERFGATLAVRRVAPSIERAEAEGTLVLVVDDHPTNRLIMLHQVIALGYAAESAEDGLQALSLWESGRYGLVITDCNMPRMNGHELARAIRARESVSGAGRVPIIACTANALGGEAEACFGAGMDDYVVKPVQLAELMKRLDQWLPVPQTMPAPLDELGGPDRCPAALAIDRTILQVISNGDPGIERDIMLDFRRVNDGDSLMLRRAVGNADAPLVTRVAHRIKGASQMVGASDLAAACERIEMASRDSNWKAVELGMEAFQVEMHRLNAFLDTQRALDGSLK
jgi:signal transduction histidine kinase/CheY-like chemotaxis protein/HPt (histidine-containing phosphotransfer) domain-containing protein